MAGMRRFAWLLPLLSAAGCYCSHPRPMDVGIDAPDAGADVPADACVLLDRTCDPHVDRSALAIPTEATFDGETLRFSRVLMVTSSAFAVFHGVSLVPDSAHCATPRLWMEGWPSAEWTDPNEPGPREATFYLESPSREVLHRGEGTMDVISYDDEAHVWHGRLVVDDERLQLDVEITVPRCTDVSGP
jgi:hypothetical protein